MFGSCILQFFGLVLALVLSLVYLVCWMTRLGVLSEGGVEMVASRTIPFMTADVSLKHSWRYILSYFISSSFTIYLSLDLWYVVFDQHHYHVLIYILGIFYFLSLDLTFRFYRSRREIPDRSRYHVDVSSL